MDLSTHNFFQSHGEPTIEGNMSLYGKSSKDNNNNNNPFGDSFNIDPICKLNLKETSDFVKSFPVLNGVSSEKRLGQNQQRRVVLEAPPTPGRPVFSFTSSSSSIGRSLSRKGFPSKWDDAEKWLMSTTSSCHESPAHNAAATALKVVPSNKISITQCGGGGGGFKEDKSRVPNFRRSTSLDHHNIINNMFGSFNGGVSCPTDIVLKDKFTESIEPILPSFRYSEPAKEGFLFRNPAGEAMKDACTEVAHHHNEVQHKDVGTEMTPMGSSTTSRCHTPIKITSPRRHNTPESRSGPLALANTSGSNGCSNVDLIQLDEYHFSKLQLGTQYDLVNSNWSSSGEEEEEKEISKSLRHNSGQKDDSDCRASTWEEEEKTKWCLRYQREEAKIQAWLNLQNAKAEAQSKKLEVKIQKMRSNMEEKLMKKMSVVHRKAEEWREQARQQHLEQIQKATEQAQKILIHKKHSNNSHNQFSRGSSCGCFPCHNN